MSGQLSPDGRYYWDGARWASAASPDGAWRWDGRAWVPATNVAPDEGSRVPVLIAIGVIAALLVGGLGVFGVMRLLTSAQHSLQAQFTPACGANGTAGHELTEGDNLCGYRLGTSQLSAPCTGTVVPDSLKAWQQVGRGGDAVPTSLPVDSSGCDLGVPTGTVRWLETAPESADIVAVADYLPSTDWGALGIEIACNKATCVELAVDPAGVFRVDEERGAGAWKNIVKGALPLAAISRLDEPNRLVVRYRDRGLQVFLDGYLVVRVTTQLAHASGSVTFYMDDRVGTQPAEVHLMSLDVFASG